MPSFDQHVAQLFDRHADRLTRVMTRLSGEADLAADLVQEAFVRLYQRGSLPDSPDGWLVSVALNLFRNARTTHRRRERLLTVERGSAVHSEPGPNADARLSAEETRRRVHEILARIPERERHLLLLRAEGYSYRDLAAALDIEEGSVGTLLARAKALFRAHIPEGADALER